MSTRRTALKSIAAAAVTLPAIAQYQPKALTADQLKVVAALADLIIPRTDTPGASDARVHEHIDRALSRNAELKQRFLDGLRPFESIAPDQYAAQLADTRFFRALKNLTIDGYYASKEGLTQELGWSGNTFVADFQGCTHPEHQS